MDHFQLTDGRVHCEGVPLADIAEAVGTPVCVYSTATMVRHAQVLRGALARLSDPLIAYAVKANPNAAVLATLARQGRGADIVSGGEYARARAVGIPTDRIVFSRVGKTAGEMAAALRSGDSAGLARLRQHVGGAIMFHAKAPTRNGAARFNPSAPWRLGVKHFLVPLSRTRP